VLRLKATLKNCFLSKPKRREGRKIIVLSLFLGCDDESEARTKCFCAIWEAGVPRTKKHIYITTELAYDSNNLSKGVKGRRSVLGVAI
jgi:hypothetical protein